MSFLFASYSCISNFVSTHCNCSLTHSEALRYWTLEGSVAGPSGPWTLLRNHVNDASLCKKGAPYTWPVEGGAFYRCFRIKMTNPNSNDHWYCALSSIELYGDLRLPAAEHAELYSIPMPRSNAPNEFVYESDFDTNGVFYNLGTQRGQTTWTNPAKRGLVRVTSSSILEQGAALDAIVGRSVVRCVTKNIPNSWIAVEIEGQKIAPTKYTLRHYSSWDTEALRCWIFEASNDGISWHTLRTHDKDTVCSQLHFVG